jgi:hypothetical protein
VPQGGRSGWDLNPATAVPAARLLAPFRAPSPALTQHTAPTPSPHPSPPTSPDTILTIIMMAIYSADIVLNFMVGAPSGARRSPPLLHRPQRCAALDPREPQHVPLLKSTSKPHPQVAYHDEHGYLVTDHASIARHYAEWRLWVDLATTVPFDWIVLGAMGLQAEKTPTARYISLLRLLRLGRCYRLKKVGGVQNLRGGGGLGSRSSAATPCPGRQLRALETPWPPCFAPLLVDRVPHKRCVAAAVDGDDLPVSGGAGARRCEAWAWAGRCLPASATLRVEARPRLAVPLPTRPARPHPHRNFMVVFFSTHIAAW